MSNKKKTFFIILSVLAVVAIILIALNFYLKQRIENGINQALGESAYEELDVNLLQAEISLTGVDFNRKGNKITAKKVVLGGLGFYQYLVNGKIVIGELKLEQPEVTVISSEEKEQGNQQKFDSEILIENFSVSNGIFRLQKKDSVGNEIFVSFPKMTFSEVILDSTTIGKKIPFEYQEYLLEVDSLRLNMNPEHFIAAGHLRIENGQTEIQDFRIVPYYDKETFIEKIPYEKDRISLRVEKIQLDSLSFGFEKDTFYLRNSLMTVAGGDLQIYRNRILPDDPRPETLYSQKLRNAAVKLDFDEMKVEGSKIVYEEKMQQERPAAEVGFYEIEGSILNLTNVDLDQSDFPRTKINASALFQNTSPFSLDWSFNTTHLDNKFLISGEFGALPATAMNPFLRAMGMGAEGGIQEMYFTFTGNEEFLNGDVLIKYDQFKIILLKEGSREKKGLFTALVNLLVDNDGASGEQNQENIRVERIKTRSFWSYIWAGLKSGVKETFSQL